MPPFLTGWRMVKSGRFGKQMAMRTGRLISDNSVAGVAAAAGTWPGECCTRATSTGWTMRAICGEAVEVDAKLEQLRRMEADYEDTALVVVRYASGALGLMRGWCA